MSEYYFDPALQKHRERMAQARRQDARDKTLRKSAVIILGVAAGAALLCFAAYKIYVTF